MNVYEALLLAGLAVWAWWLIFVGFRGYAHDKLRQELFAVRNRLFSWAADGGIGFEHPSYRATVQLLNGLIRFAHLLTFSGALGIAMLSRRANGVAPSFEERISHAENAQKEMLRRIHADAFAQTHLHFLRTSPLFWVWLIAKTLLRIANKRREPPIVEEQRTRFERTLEAAAMTQGDPQLQMAA